MKQSLNSTQRCLGHVFLPEQQKIPGCEKHHAKNVAWSYDMEGHVGKSVEAIVNLQTRKWSSITKFQARVWMTINSSRKNSNQLERCQTFAHKLS